MRRLVVAGVAVALLAVGIVAAYVVQTRHAARDVQGSSTVEFETTTAATAPPTSAPEPSGAVEWPTFGYDDQRTRYDPTVALRPPFRKIWTFHGRTLLEFPPAVAFGRLYLPTFDGRFYALDQRTGAELWMHATGRCGWGTPAIWRRTVVVTFIGRKATCDEQVPGSDGIVVSYDADTGRVRWRRTLGPTESSPLVVRGLVLVGDWNNAVWALDARTGATRWRFRTDGQVKGSLSLGDDLVYVGDYAGHVYALRARTGALVWKGSAQPRLGTGGRFYSSPAVAYGRVYLGATDGKVYSFGARSGRLRWSHSTGSYVYASPAVWRGLVLIGSYDERFYALDAATGEVRWRFQANGIISGAATVLAGVVYFSTYAERTYALDARTGRLLWTFPDGQYSPVVADAKRLYLVGHGRLYGMVSR